MANKMIAADNSLHGEMSEDFGNNWTNIGELKGAKIVIHGFRFGESNFTPGKRKATVDLTFEGDDIHYGWSSEGKAILDALELNAENCPFECVLETRVSKKNNKEYPVLV